MKRINWVIIKSKDRGTDYGVGTFIKQLTKGLLQQKNIEVFVIEMGDVSVAEFNVEKKYGITYFYCGQIDYLNNTRTIANHSKFAKSLVRIILPLLPKECMTIIHLNFVYQCFIAEEFKKAIDCRMIFTQHLFIPQSAGTNLLEVESRTYSLADRIITVTNHGKDQLMTKLVEADKISPIYNGIEPKLFITNTNRRNIRRKYGIGVDEKIVLYSGRIDLIKGLKYLYIAFEILLEKLPDCRLVIAGNGDYEELIRSSKSFSSNINYLGFIPFEDLSTLYQEASIGVIPSLEEQCSYVALEMLHSGLPVVASNIGGLKEIFIHGENAFLTEVISDNSNPYGIAPKVSEFANYMYLLLSDNDLHFRFGQNAKIRANELFTLKNMTKDYIQTINSFLYA